MPARNNIPEFVVMSGEYSDLCVEMEKYIKVIRTELNQNLPHYLRYHADMQFIDFGDTVFIIPGSEYLEECFLHLGKHVFYTESAGTEYPMDVKCNGKLLDGKLLCNVNTISPLITDYCKLHNIEILGVKQGYTGCSTLFINDFVVSSDKKIVEVCLRNGLESFLIENRDIKLNGYDCGFIGGASGYFDNTCFLTGSCAKTGGAEFLKGILESRNINMIELANDKLTDIGGIIPIYKNI